MSSVSTEKSNAAPTPRGKVAYARSIPFLIVHVIGIVGPFFLPFSWKWVALAIGLYYLRMFGITAGYHRYFSHRAFKTSRAFQFVLAWMGSMTLQKGVLWWAGHHRNHHRFSDTPEDIHSPIQGGFFWSHVGWVLSDRFEAHANGNMRDMERYPELRWLDKYYWVPAVVMGAVLLAAGGLPALIWGLFTSTTILWHGTFTINSLAHVFGRRRYETSDGSRNSMILALLTMGEGWHNNHHHYQSTANQGWFWWEIDLSYYILKGLAAVGLVWDLRLPPRHIRDGQIASDETAPSELIVPIPPIPSTTSP
jgi:stearoyl-CoA desaturase (Delta-9 desaturase)